MKCSNADCDRRIGLVAYRHGWFSKRRYCSQRCRNSEKSVLKHFTITCVVLVGLIVPATFAMAVLAASPSPQSSYLPGCDRNLADANASVTAMQTQIKNLSGADASKICTATRLYFFEVVLARALTALCKNGPERERDLNRFDADVANANDAIAAHCL